MCTIHTFRIRFMHEITEEKWFLNSSCLCVFVVQGCIDLFWLPVEQYRRDGRIVRGLQRGANSFMTCTAMSALELTNRVVMTVQVLFQTSVLISTRPTTDFALHYSLMYQ